jgi:Putative prokaryotic signal transducing protein
MDYANLVVVHECGSEIEADLAKGALQAAGIDAMIQADTAGRQRDHIAWSGAGFKLLVREEDAVDAREVLDAPPVE